MQFDRKALAWKVLRGNTRFGETAANGELAKNWLKLRQVIAARAVSI
jgi:hypothetical protein